MFSKFFIKLFVIFYFLFLFSSFVYADDLSLQLYKQSYKSFETVQVNVIIENSTLTRELDVSNLIFLTETNSSLTLAKNKIKVNASFYVFYFDLPSLASGMYSLGVTNVNYLKAGVVRNGNFYVPLQILNSGPDFLSIRPAYFMYKLKNTEEAQSSFFITNHGNTSVNVAVNNSENFLKLDKTDFTLSPGTTTALKLSTFLKNTSNETIFSELRINYGTNFYVIPVLIFRSDIPNFTSSQTNNQVNTTLQITKFNTTSSLLFTTLLEEVKTNLTFTVEPNEQYQSLQYLITNKGNVPLHNINYTLNGSVFGFLELQPRSLEVLASLESAVLSLRFNTSARLTFGNYSGFLNLLSKEGDQLSIPITLRVLGNALIKPSLNVTPVLINATQNDSDIFPPEQKNNISGWIFFLVILFVLIIIVFYFYKKTRQKNEFDDFVDNMNSRRN